MNGFGVYIDAPQMPFVIPTYIFRPVRPFLRPLWSTVSAFAHWLWGFVFYLFEEDGSLAVANGASSRTIVQGVTESVVSSGLGNDWSMMNDELV
jgi:hypothetical protein